MPASYQEATRLGEVDKTMAGLPPDFAVHYMSARSRLTRAEMDILRSLSNRVPRFGTSFESQIWLDLSDRFVRRVIRSSFGPRLVPDCPVYSPCCGTLVQYRSCRRNLHSI